MTGNPILAPIPAPVLALSDVVKDYVGEAGTLRALHGVSMTVAHGELMAIMGPSGSGKSTAMNILGCLDTPTAGQYLFKGEHVEALSRDQRARLRRRYLGFVFQGFNLLARTSAQENVELPLLYRGDSAAARRSAAAKALHDVGLGGWEQHTPGELSGGQQQRVAIARAIVTQPAVVLADEPTGNLDRATADTVFATMLELTRQRGMAFVLVTHDEKLAGRCDRVMRLEKGRLADAPAPS